MERVRRPDPSGVLDAAELALDLAVRQQRMLANTKIPLIVHQTWRDTNTISWPLALRVHVEAWLFYALGPGLPWSRRIEGSAEMAYILWDDAGVDALMQWWEPQFFKAYKALPLAIERADVFRITVVKWFGGVVNSPLQLS